VFSFHEYAKRFGTHASPDAGGISCEYLRTDADVREGIEEPENIQEPENDRDYYDRVQDGFDCALHGDEAVDQPKHDSYHDQDHYHC
jgi:hypothetical protein